MPERTDTATEDGIMLGWLGWAGCCKWEDSVHHIRSTPFRYHVPYWSCLLVSAVNYATYERIRMPHGGPWPPSHYSILTSASTRPPNSRHACCYHALCLSFTQIFRYNHIPVRPGVIYCLYGINSSDIYRLVDFRVDVTHESGNGH